MHTKHCVLILTCKHTHTHSPVDMKPDRCVHLWSQRDSQISTWDLVGSWRRHVKPNTHSRPLHQAREPRPAPCSPTDDNQCNSICWTKLPLGKLSAALLTDLLLQTLQTAEITTDLIRWSTSGDPSEGRTTITSRFTADSRVSAHLQWLNFSAWSVI